VPFGPLYVRELPVSESSAALDSGGEQRTLQSDTVVHFLLPLAGRMEALTRFLGNYERVVLMRHELATLTVILYQDGADGGEGDHDVELDAAGGEEDVQVKVRALTLRYPAALISIVHVSVLTKSLSYGIVSKHVSTVPISRHKLEHCQIENNFGNPSLHKAKLTANSVYSCNPRAEM
ncbi:Chondroitin N-acetylgalactosaminyltransferase, partial [Trinorchestia longiramus]